MIINIQKYKNDEWGGIDPKIQKLVIELNRLGMKTTGSCEGHVDGHRSPSPWVKITGLDTLQTKRFLKQTSDFLYRFYGNRIVADDVRIAIKKAHSGFWIHNGGKLYDAWRKQVDRNVRNRKNKIVTKTMLSAHERLTRGKKLSSYQREMQKFSQFLSRFK